MELPLEISQMLPISKATLILKDKLILSSTLKSVRLLMRVLLSLFLAIPFAHPRFVLLVIYLPHSYFVTDHKQAWREADEPRIVPKNEEEAETQWAIEEDKRWKMRKQMFPDIRDDTVIFANWNQLYKVNLTFPSPSA